MKVEHPHWGWQSYLPYSNGGYIEWKHNCWLEICLIKNFPFFCTSWQRMVIQTKSVKYMPFYLSLVSFLNGVCWTAYSLLRFDLYILVRHTFLIFFLYSVAIPNVLITIYHTNWHRLKFWLLYMITLFYHCFTFYGFKLGLFF